MQNSRRPAAILGVLLACSLAAPAVAQGTDPVGRWKLDEGSGTAAFDATGGGLDGTLVNTPGWSTDVPTVRFANPASLSFDGSNDCVEFSAGFVSGISDTFTMVLWVKPTGTRVPTLERNTEVNGAGGQRYAVYPGHGGDEAGAGISVGTDGISVFEHGSFYLPSLLVQDMVIQGWVHVAVVYVDKQPSLYVDGVHRKTGLTSSKVVHPSLGLGGTPGNVSYGPYMGWIDDYRIYDRALTTDEIASLASGFNGFDRSPPGAAVLGAGGSSHDTVTLTWTAPEDDAGIPASGAVTTHTLRHTTAGVIDTQAKFDAATPFVLPFAPGAPGSAQGVVVTGLAPLTTYFFCLTSTDDEGRVSPLSNSPSAMTPADTPPAATVLTVVEAGVMSVTLGWTAPGDDGLSGTAVSYDLRSSTAGPIDSESKFLAASRVPGAPAPAAGGTFQTFVVTGLKHYTTYHFALKTRDGNSGTSPLSNSLATATLSGGSMGPSAACLGSASGGMSWPCLLLPALAAWRRARRRA